MEIQTVLGTDIVLDGSILFKMNLLLARHMYLVHKICIDQKMFLVPSL